VIVIPSEVWHWHGATKDSRFAHIAITGISGAGGGNLPMEPLTEAEYDAAHQ
jgi:4-carboxymuconolactone decarboxylase